jgi:TolB-like protein/Flp pilus assembly protein TadD
MARRLAAILAADVVGFSRLMEIDENGTLAALQAHRAGIIEPLVARSNGRIVKLMGDGALVEFASVVDAVACAVAIQQGMAERNAGTSGKVRIDFRIGVNLGDVIVEGDDIYGDGVNVAARLEALASPGGVCISGTVRDHIAGKLDHEFADGGEQSVKNMSRPVHVWRWSSGVSAPAAEPVKSPAGPISNKPSIAVLPFTNMSGDPEQDYFSDGITEDIITELARNRGLFVMARNSSFAFKGVAVDVAAVGRKLGVRYVVEGSVRKAGNRVRITAQLIEVTTGGHVWAERYDRDLEDIFAVQDEVTKSIAAAVPGQLESDIVKSARRKPTESLDAYDYYLRGKQLYHGWRDDDISEAMAALEVALKLDPTFARAHAKLGQMYLRRWWRTYAPHDLESADRETGLAVRLDNEDSECLCYRGFLLIFIRDFDGSLDHLQRAQLLKPDDPDIGAILALYFAYTGEAEKAIERVRRAMRANPNFPPWYHEVHGIALTTARRYEEAVRSFLVIPSPAYYVHVWLAACLAKLGRLDEARAHARTASDLRPEWTAEDWTIEYKNEDDIAHAVELGRLVKDTMQSGT